MSFDKYDDLGDDELDPLSDAKLRDTYINLRQWEDAARLCRDMDAIRACILSDEDAELLRAFLPDHLELERDGGIWNVVDRELIAAELNGDIRILCRICRLVGVDCCKLHMNKKPAVAQ